MRESGKCDCNVDIRAPRIIILKRNTIVTIEEWNEEQNHNAKLMDL